MVGCSRKLHVLGTRRLVPERALLGVGPEPVDALLGHGVGSHIGILVLRHQGFLVAQIFEKADQAAAGFAGGCQEGQARLVGG
jgi:hypothetical protein